MSKFGSTEPLYVGARAIEHLASDAKTVKAGDSILRLLNACLDEFLFLSLGACSTTSTTVVADVPAAHQTNAKIAVPITCSVFKTSGLLRVCPNTLGRDAALEAELAIREAVKTGSKRLRADPALSKREPPHQIEANLVDTYEELRVWIMSLSSLSDLNFGNPSFNSLKSVGDDNSYDALKSSVAAGLRSTNQPAIGPGLALYVSEALSSVAQTIIRSTGQVIDRDATVQEISPAHLLAAMKESDNIWECFQGMQSRRALEKRASLGRSSSISRFRRQASLSSRPTATSHKENGSSRTPFTSPNSIKSHRKRSGDSISEHPAPLTPHRQSNDSANTQRDFMEMSASDDEDDLDFESQLNSGQTLNLSLTPDRLKSMEAYNQSKAAKRLSSGMVLASPGANRPSAGKTAASRFAPRSAVKIDEEPSDDDEDFGYGKKVKKESLAELFASDPPWASKEEDALPRSFHSGSMPSKLQNNASAPQAAQSLPSAQIKGAYLVPAPSSNSDSVTPSSSTGELDVFPQPPTPTARKYRAPRMQPKDERSAPVGSQDLINFLAHTPPSAPDPFLQERRVPSDGLPEPARKKSSNKLRNLMGKFSSTHGQDEGESSSYTPMPPEAYQSVAFGQMPRQSVLPVSQPSDSWSHSLRGMRGSQPPASSHQGYASNSTRRLHVSSPVADSASAFATIKQPAFIANRERDAAAVRMSPPATQPKANNNANQPLKINTSESVLQTHPATLLKSTSQAPITPRPRTSSSGAASGARMAHGLPTPVNSIEDIADLSRGNSSEHRQKPSVPPTPPITPDRRESFKVKRVPSPRVEESVFNLPQAIREVKEISDKQPDPSSPPKAPLQRRRYSIKNERVRTPPAALSADDDALLSPNKGNTNSDCKESAITSIARTHSPVRKRSGSMAAKDAEPLIISEAPPLPNRDENNSSQSNATTAHSRETTTESTSETSAASKAEFYDAQTTDAPASALLASLRTEFLRFTSAKECIAFLDIVSGRLGLAAPLAEQDPDADLSEAVNMLLGEHLYNMAMQTPKKTEMNSDDNSKAKKEDVSRLSPDQTSLTPDENPNTS